jgi:hypothetical protein
MKGRKKIAEFEGVCQRCEGTGLWMKRAGYPCRGCGSTGKCRVALMLTTALGEFGGVTFRVISAKGNITKETYEATAELTAEYRRYNCGATVGGGWYENYQRTDPVGAECGVYGITPGGELAVRLPGGGYSATGDGSTMKDGHYREVKVRVTEAAAAAAIEEALAARLDATG